MEIKIGVQHVAREISFETQQTPEEVEQAVADALKSGDLLRLMDERGGLVLVPSRNIGYLEIGAPRRGGVGFGTL